MPRAFDSDEQKHAEVPPKLVFVEIVDCENCGYAFTGTFVDSSMDAEDMVEPPTAQLRCTVCGHEFEAVYSGWANYGDA